MKRLDYYLKDRRWRDAYDRSDGEIRVTQKVTQHHDGWRVEMRVWEWQKLGLYALYQRSAGGKWEQRSIRCGKNPSHFTLLSSHRIFVEGELHDEFHRVRTNTYDTEADARDGANHLLERLEPALVEHARRRLLAKRAERQASETVLCLHVEREES